MWGINMKKLLKILNKILIVYLIFVMICCIVCNYKHNILLDGISRGMEESILSTEDNITIDINNQDKVIYTVSHHLLYRGVGFDIISQVKFDNFIIPKLNTSCDYYWNVLDIVDPKIEEICNRNNTHYIHPYCSCYTGGNAVMLSNGCAIQNYDGVHTTLTVLVPNIENWLDTKEAVLEIYDKLQRYFCVNDETSMQIEVLTLKDGAEPIYNIIYTSDIIKVYEPNSELLHELEDAFEIIRQ